MDRAVGLAAELLANYQHIIEELELVTSSGGAFEVSVNSELIFSKKQRQKRHAQPGEVLGIFRDLIGPDVPTYPQDS
ncbi:MAG: Rdx family protein [Candidatus Promineifilaceae bacterium]